MNMVLSYIKELLSSFIDDNLKKIWAILQGTILTFITALLKPCYAFPMPEKHLLEELTASPEADTEDNAPKNRLIHDINFTKNTILVLITLMVGDAVSSDFSSQVQENVTKVFSVGLYFISLLLFLTLGRLWSGLFGAPDVDKRRVDSWFSFEFNMLFLFLFSVNYVDSHFFGIKDGKANQSIIGFSLFFSMTHLIYFFVCLRKSAAPKLAVAYYWGVNIFLVFSLTFLSTVAPSTQVVFKNLVTIQKQQNVEKQANPPEQAGDEKHADSDKQADSTEQTTPEKK